MISKTKLKEGEVLLLLQRQSGKTVFEVAQMLNIHPNHLSKLFKSERLSAKIRSKAANVFGVQESDFSGNTIAEFPHSANEPDVKYEKKKVDEMSAAEVLRYLEEKDRRHYEERGRLLAIIENLTKK